jgi:hypothetical protein
MSPNDRTDAGCGWLKLDQNSAVDAPKYRKWFLKEVLLEAWNVKATLGCARWDTVVTSGPRVSGLNVHPNLLDMRECAGKCLGGEVALQLVAPRHIQAGVGSISRGVSPVAQSWMNEAHVAAVED